MVLEVAQVPVLAGHEREFEDALQEAAATVLPQAVGFVEFAAIGWCIERPSVLPRKAPHRPRTPSTSA